MRIIILALLFFFTHLSYNSLYGQDDDIYSYLSENKSIITDIGSNFNFDFCNYNFFITGEFHGRSVNDDIFFMMLKYMYFKNHVRIIILEENYSRGYLINHFLETGDSNTFEILSEGWLLCERELFKKIKMFYDELPNNDKFRCVGVDYDQEEEFLVIINAIKQISLNVSFAPASIRGILTEIDQTDKYLTYEQGMELIKSLIESRDEYPQDYRLFYADNNNVFDRIINGVIQSERIWGPFRDTPHDSIDSVKFIIREDMIHGNIAKVITDNPKAGFFARFGIAHIGLRNMIETPGQHRQESFISKLARDVNRPSYVNVCSIAICNRDPIAKRFFKKIFSRKIAEGILRNCKTDSAVIFKLDNNPRLFFKSDQCDFQYLLVP